MVNKTTCEKYDIKLTDSGWAIISICEADGSVSILSDYGNWGHIWPCHGSKSLKHFLVSIGEDYAWCKFSGKSKYNHAKSIEGVKKYLLDEKPDDYEDKLEEIELFDEFGSSDLFYSEMEDIGIEESHYFIHEDSDPQFMMFYNRLWMPFVEYLRKEIED